MREFWTCVLLLAALAFPMPSSASQTFELWPGKSVEVLGVGTMNFTEGPPALMLKYQTAIPLSDMAELTKEVDAIWNRFVVDAETQGFTVAIVSANNPPTGGPLITNNKAYNFIYKRGFHYWQQSGQPIQRTIDKAEEVEEFASRLDYLMEKQLWNALLSTMAEEWTSQVLDPAGRIKGSTFLDPMLLIRAGRELHARHSVKRKRETLSVTIAPDRLSATIESRESTEITSDTLDVAFVSRLSDVIEARGEKLFWKRSLGTLEELVDRTKK